MFTLANVRIEHLERFLDVFGSEGAENREAHGCVESRVFTAQGDPTQVYLLLEWRDNASFEAFMDDPETPAIMSKGGADGSPTFIILEAAARFDA